MEGIIWLIAMGIFVYFKAVSGQNKDQSANQRQNRPAQNQGYRPAQQNIRPGQNRNSGVWNPEHYKASQEAVRRELANRQRELKERLTNKYGNGGTGARQQQAARNAQQGTAYGNQRRPVQQAENRRQQADMSDILSRATANVRENDKDQLEMERKGHAAQMMSYAYVPMGVMDRGETSELMREVNDLMIMGYQGNLAFTRDFIAEGVDMLNSYELSEEI